MKKNNFKLQVFLLFSFFICSSSLEGLWSPKKPDVLVLDHVPTLTAEEHYERACSFYNEGVWERASKEFYLVAENFRESSCGQDANFFLGVSYFQMGEFDLADAAFDNYLQSQSNPLYFMETLDYKFQIAESLRMGAKTRLFCAKQLPKWGSGKELAVKIYDEIAVAMPNSRRAVLSLYGKGVVLWQNKDYEASVEALQTLINRFPKDELAPESFLLINRVYYDQCMREFQNPDLLAFAEINVHKFEAMFPGEERLDFARSQLVAIKEVLAKGMFDTASFYERINQPGAAVLYYQKAIVDFPETRIALACKNRLASFRPDALRDIEAFVEGLKEKVQDCIPEDFEFTGFSP